MSTYDDASLILYPSGYKASKLYSLKPTDGSGDLDVVRATTATRVNSDGLIEKVRTNLLLQSNTFDTTWANTRSSEVSGQAGYDGTNNAWGIIGTIDTNTHLIAQPITLSAELLTFSVFAKAGAQDFCILRLDDGSSVSTAFFDLSTGTKGTIAPAFSNSEIVSVGGGWYRISVSRIAISGSNFAIIFPAPSDGVTTYAGDGVTPDLFIQNAQIERGDIATDYIATTSAAVSVGPVANVPRLDYLNSSCPRLLLEPQRTNLVTFSEQINNAAWAKQTGVTIVANNATSPDGNQNADLLYSTTGTNKRIFQTATISSGTSYTFSVFAKSAGKDFVFFVDIDNAQNTVWFNLSNGTFSTPVEGTATIVDYGNGWYRCSLTTTSTGTNGFSFFGVSDTSGSVTFTENGTDGVLFYGAQLEQGSYATSYIPTLGAAVTRGADAASKTGISSLIGQTEGTIYLEANIQKYNESGFYVAISAGAVLGTAIYLFQPSSGNLQVLIRNIGNPDASITINSANWTAGFNKVAIAYTATTAEVFINGVSKGTTSFVSAPACSKFAIGSRPDAAGQLVGSGGYSQAILFKTRLTNTQLAELTTL